MSSRPIAGELFAPDFPRAENKRRKKGEGKPKPGDLLAYQFEQYKLPPYVRELMFAKGIGRKWRFDFAFPSPFWVAVEIEGLVVMRLPSGELIVKGRHASITGFREDAIKYATAAIFGWTVLRFEQGQVRSGDALEYTQRVLAARGWKR